MRRISNIIVHWAAAGSPNLDVESIRALHMAPPRNWRDIGYHRIILHPEHRRFRGMPAEIWSDLVKQGRPLDEDLYIEAHEIGAHALGYNSSSVGVCVIAGPKLPPSPQQIVALRETLDILTSRFELPKTVVKGHREVNATECPGNILFSFLKTYRGD